MVRATARAESRSYWSPIPSTSLVETVPRRTSRIVMVVATTKMDQKVFWSNVNLTARRFVTYRTSVRKTVTLTFENVFNMSLEHLKAKLGDRKGAKMVR